jgi:hypothetical protein
MKQRWCVRFFAGSSRRGALLGLALLTLPLAAAAQPAVTIATRVVTGSGSQAGDYSIQVGSTSYVAADLPPLDGQPARGGFQVLVLDRATLALVSNQSFTTDVGSAALDCTLQSKLASALLDLSSASLVILSSIVGPPDLVSGDPACPGLLGSAIESLGGTDAVGVAGTVYSLVGIPGLGSGNGWERSSATSPGSAASLTGYLLVDSSGLAYTFRSFAAVQLVTRTTDAAGNPAISLQAGYPWETTYSTAPPLPAGATGGYQVVVLDRQTLAPVSNATYGTNTPQDPLVGALQACLMAEALIGASAAQLVIVSSLGDPGALVDPLPGCAELPLAGAIQQIGGTGAAVGAANYSLVTHGPPLDASLVPEASAIITPGIPAQLTVILQPDRQGFYTPVNGDGFGAGVVNYGLYAVASMPSQGWPVPASAGQASAFQYLSYVMQQCECETLSSCSPPAPDPSLTTFPACGTQTGSSNIRARYCEDSPETSTWQAVLGCLTFDQIQDPPFAEGDFAAVQDQLLLELTYVNEIVTNFRTPLTSAITDLAVDDSSGQQSVLSALLGDVLDNLAASHSSKASLDALDLVQGAGMLASAAASFGTPALQAAIGLLNTGIQVGIDLTTTPSGGSAAVLQAVEIEDLAAKLFAQDSGVFSGSLNGVTQLSNVILTDWARLQAAGQAVQGDATWNPPDTFDSATTAALTPGFEIGFYQALLPVVTDVVFFGDVPFDSPRDYLYAKLVSCDRAGCQWSCSTPYAGAPSGTFFAAGDDPWDLFLLDPYPSSTVTGRLFNSPGETSSPGLGILPAQLFSRIRGWGGLTQILPVNWSEYATSCPSSAPGPAPRPVFKGKAEKVGASGDGGKVSFEGRLALTGALDLKAATVTVRELLDEATGAGELVRGAGGTPILPLTLAAGNGSKASQATFRTPTGTRPGLKLEVKNRDPRRGELEVKLTVERATMTVTPGACGPGSPAFLRTRFTLHDGVNEPVTLNVELPWRCDRDRLATP